MFWIGRTRVTSPLVLAPMSGISDLPFRLINRSLGCELAFTEMLSGSLLARQSRNTLKMLSTTETDRPLGVQIVGDDPELLKRAIDVLSEYRFDMLNLNAACPVGKIVSKGEGASLLRNPAKLQRILKVLSEYSAIPVTVKIRSGWDTTSINAVEVALRAQDAGAKALFIHGRTKVQGYSGKVDYDIIRQVRSSVAIPVIASGDALRPDLVKRLLKETGCAGVAVARGALGNPWIFRETADHLKGTTVSARDIGEITRVMKEHLGLNIAFHGEKMGVIRFRKFFVWYTAGVGTRELKARALRAVNSEEMAALIGELQGTPKQSH